MAPSWAKRFWHFIWEEDTPASWIANVILAFVLIKFLVYPGLGFLLGTSHPIVAVVSGSMEHDGSFDEWWASSCPGSTQDEMYKAYQIDKDTFRSFSLKNGFDKGDIMILKGTDNPKVGDVIVYSIQEQPDPIIHRVVASSQSNGHNLYKTKGDHNCGTNGFEERIHQDQVLGKAIIRVPWLGWVKLAFMKLVQAIMGLVG